MQNVRTIVGDENERMRKEVVRVYFKVIHQNLPGENEE
jgi:hypothetical protein